MCDVLLTWGLIVGAIAGACLVDRWYGYALAAVVIGGRQNALATLAHEGWHGLLVASRGINHFMGAWLYAYPIGILYNNDRDRHLRHHREVGHEYDPDWINYSTRHRDSPTRVMAYLASLLCGPLLLATAWVFTRGRPGIAGHQQECWENSPERWSVNSYSFRDDIQPDDGGPSIALMLPSDLAGFFANFRAFVEHVGARRCRRMIVCAISGSALWSVFVAPSHFNYHALHHTHPFIPHYNFLAEESLCGPNGRLSVCGLAWCTRALLAHHRNHTRLMA